ncbi:hypothetical protein G9A89_012098 [Geosiphon pyriformis]|nr:hypothetical protein G9A89_012098 [Geosiphon pyriformis]
MENRTRNHALLVENYYQEGATGTTYQAEEEHVMQLANTRSSSVTGALKRLQHYPHNKDELYNTTQAKVRRRTVKEIRCWKESAKVADEITSYNMFDPVDEFQDYYQQLCPTRQEQKQYLAQINTYLCKNCLSDGPKLEKFVAYTNLKQVIDIQYFDNGHLEIILERIHPTDARFNLRYSEDQFTTLLPRSITKIDLKIVVKISPRIMVQIASRLSLAKKGISVQREVIDSGYTENLMVLLQNNSEKPYTIEFKKKIAQAIFLPLVKIGKFVPVENCEELSQTTRETFGFRLTRKEIEANFAETIEKKSKVIKNEQSIMFLPYEKSEIRIKRTIKEKDLIFKLYPKTCQQFFIGLTNFFIPVDKAQWIKIPITNTTEELIYIPEDTIIGYLGMELENASTLQEILNFPEIVLYCELTSINWQQPLECYQFMPEELAKLNIGTMDPD